MVTVTAYIALGSNLGDRRAYLDQALESMRAAPGVRLGPVSSYHETAPVGGPPGQESYLNAAAGLQTELPPEALLKLLLEVEQRLGRVRQERFGPRTIDLDLLLYGDQVVRTDPLTLPHPRLHDRLFVLEPLSEIAPRAVHPILGATIVALRDRQRLLGSTAAPPRELSGLRAVVTGSSSGIGRAIAMELALGGADVLVHRRRSGAATTEPLLLLSDTLRTCGVRSEALFADLHDLAQCGQLVQAAWDTWQGLDIWINNAGADTLTGTAAHWSFEQKLAELLTVDVTATLLIARDVGRRLKAQGGGVIINMGWDQAKIGMAGDSGELFAAAKGAVMAFSKSLALSLAPEVRVNCLAPGWIRTSWGETASSAWQERVRRETPLQRWGKPEDVAATVRWLVAPAAAYITGQVIRVNGGAVR
jgi:2-amino-4-hydroxy-6-hydroxymethyldihydropteridine diphosphokinase